MLGLQLPRLNRLRSFVRLLGGPALVLCNTSTAQVGLPTGDDDFRLMLEEPQGTHSGIGNIRGWAVADVGIYSIELFINGKYQFDIPYGSERRDVGYVYPQIANSDYSGFGMAFNFGTLSYEDLHTLTVRATSNRGETLYREVSFRVDKFNREFLDASNAPDITSVTECFKHPYSQIEGNFPILLCSSVRVNCADNDKWCSPALAENDWYDIAMIWDTPSQSFKLVDTVEGYEDYRDRYRVYYVEPEKWRVEHAITDEFFVIAGQAFLADGFCRAFDQNDMVRFDGKYEYCSTVRVTNDNTGVSCTLRCVD